MKWAFITIGLILLIGGICAVREPKPWSATLGGGKSNLPATVQEMPKEIYMGYVAIGLGFVAIIVGMKSGAAFIPPIKSKTEKQSADEERAEL